MTKSNTSKLDPEVLAIVSIMNKAKEEMHPGESKLYNCPSCGKDSLEVICNTLNGHLALRCECGLYVLE